MATVLSDIKELTKRIASLEATVKTLIQRDVEMEADVAAINAWIVQHDQLNPHA